MNHNRATIAALGRCVLALISVCALGSSLSAAPMVYTGLVVTDVRVGTRLFHNASLKMTFEGDTNDIVQVPIPSTECNGPSDSTYTTDCLQGEAWNYVNSGSGGFQFRSGILDQLSAPGVPSTGVQSLPQFLSQSTLLTGPVHACAGFYTIGSTIPFVYLPGDLFVCGGPAPQGLHTSRGDLFLQDLVAGSLSLGNSPIVGNESGSDPGWDLSNSGSLHVEVFRGDD